MRAAFVAVDDNGIVVDGTAAVAVDVRAALVAVDDKFNAVDGDAVVADTDPRFRVKIARNLSVKELLMSNLESWGVVVSYKNL